jgi:hypothetical protein
MAPVISPKGQGAASSKPIYLQIGTLPSIELATKEAARMAGKYAILANQQISVRPFKTTAGKTVYRLLVGPLVSDQAAKNIAKALGL